MIGTCTSQSSGVDELLLNIKESIGLDGTCPLESSDIEMPCPSRRSPRIQKYDFIEKKIII